MINIIKLFILYSFCQGLLFHIGIPNNYYKYGIIIFTFILLFFILALPFRKRKYSFLFFLIYFSYTIVLIISAYINDSPAKHSFSYLLYSLPAFLLSFLFINRRISDNQIKNINNFIFFIAGFQILYSILKVIVWGTRETVAGTIHFSNGSLNTIFPLISIAMLMAFYIYYKQNNIYLLLSIGFLFMGWAGEKRGIYFYLIGLIIVAYLLYIKLENRFSWSNIKGLLAIIILGPILIYMAGRLTYTLNPDEIIGGEFNLNYLIQYAINYSFQYNQEGFAAGRLSGLIDVFFNVLNSGFKTRLFGYGPDSVIGMSNMDYVQYKFGVSSFLGIIGFTTALVSIGFFGTLFTIIIYLFIAVVSFRYTKREQDPYWKSIGFGTLLITMVFFLDFFTYSRTFLHSVPLNIALFYFFSIIIIKYNSLNVRCRNQFYKFDIKNI